LIRLPEINFSKLYTDSHTSIALQTLLDLDVSTIFIVGYDGYIDTNFDQKSSELMSENNYLFEVFISKYKGEILSLTETLYDLAQESIYSIIERYERS
jgi:4-hydroxy 2-oxovalerate aldolase